MIAALYVAKGGTYYGLPDVEPWGLPDRDAREYAGPWAVVAHPPCARWGSYYFGSPSSPVRWKLGDDGGCFEAAVSAVRRFGGVIDGVIEHPEGSRAFQWFGLPVPSRGGWVREFFRDGASCCIEQGWYGHRARKSTWLYAVADTLPSLPWGRAPGEFASIDLGYRNTETRRRRPSNGRLKQLSKRQRAATPEKFRDLLLDIARSAR